MKYFWWLLRAAIFFALFAFALNNQHEVTVHFFFGTQWRASLVLVVLAAFTLGLVLGVLGIVPRWWRQRRAARAADRQSPGASAGPVPAAAGSAASAPSASGIDAHGI